MESSGQERPRLPRNSEIVKIGNAKNGKPDVKPNIERALSDDKVLEAIEPYITDGGIEGHKVLDAAQAVRIIVDREPTIRETGLNTKEVIDQFNVVLRRHYVLNKFWKYEGLNNKQYRLRFNKTTTNDA